MMQWFVISVVALHIRARGSVKGMTNYLSSFGILSENALFFNKFCFVKDVIKDTINEDFIVILNQNTVPTKQEIINAFYKQINFAYEEFTKKED